MASGKGKQAQLAQSPTSRSLPMEFMLGGTSTMAACLFTNPIEVVKTRMQLQGELLQKSSTMARTYKNGFDAFYKILTLEGIRGMQGGLAPALLYQLSMNGTRLGLYGPVKRLIGADKDKDDILKKVVAGGSCGVFAAFVGSPFFMIKVRLQSQSTSSMLQVGHQHTYNSFTDGVKDVVAKEGLSGLFRGSSGAMLRVGVGSSVQLSSYDKCKDIVLSSGMFRDNIYAHFAASSLAGFCVTVAMNPPDVISTRLYNQPLGPDGKGLHYKGLSDCFVKTIKNEGPLSLYKGFFPHFMRLCPHTILTFVFWEQAKRLATSCGV